MTTFEFKPTQTPPHPLQVLFKSVKEIESWERIQITAVREARAMLVSWADIAQTLGTSRQAAQQRFAKHVPTEFYEEWFAVKSEGKLVYWRRHRTDKSRLTVTKNDDGTWDWAHRSPDHEILNSGTAKTVATAKKQAEAHVTSP